MMQHEPDSRLELTARTTALSSPPDLLAESAGGGALFWDPHLQRGLAAHGVALEIDLPNGSADESSVLRAGGLLSAISTQDDVGLAGCGPVAIGALPFDPTSPGRLVVPARLVGRDGDVGWETRIDPSRAPASPTEPPFIGSSVDGLPFVGSSGASDPPDEFTLTPSMRHAEWMKLVARTVEILEDADRGGLRKVVLARRVDIDANRPFLISDVLARLAALYPTCVVFSMRWGDVGRFIGASPEVLVSRTGDSVVSQPLAGTVARSGDPGADESAIAALMASPKARREHSLVVQAIAATLAEVCEDLSVPDQPSVLGLRNVSHLSTRITGRLPERRTRSAFELAALLHPTPAVCGCPPENALEYIQDTEGFERGPYSGPVGWVDARGDGVWALGIRSATIFGRRASIYAGNGVVAGSDPADELIETQLKLQALLAALVRP